MCKTALEAPILNKRAFMYINNVLIHVAKVLKP